MPPACSIPTDSDLPPEGGNYKSQRRGGIVPFRSCRFRLQAELLILILLVTGCAARTGKTNDDATMATRVKIALLNDARVGGQRLEVKTFQGVVTLSGTVKSKTDEDAAIAAARTIQGVRDVKSELKIEGSQGSRASAVQ
jgi:hypothetical protein